MTQKIGLKAVLNMSDFQQGMHDYVSGVGQMETETEDLQRTLVSAGVEIDSSFALAGATALAAAKVIDAAMSYVIGSLRDATKEVYGQSEEWEELTIAHDMFWQSVILSAAPRENLLRFFETLTGWINTASGKVLEAGAKQAGYNAVLAQMTGQSSEAQYALQGVKGVLTGMGVPAQLVERLAVNTALWAEKQGLVSEEVGLSKAYVDAYNKSLESNYDTLEEISGAAENQRKAEEKTAKMVEELTRLRDRASDKYQSYMAQTLAAEEKYNQRVIDMNINRARRLEDLDRRLVQRRQQLAQQLAQRMAEIEAQEAERTEEARYEHSRRMAEIEETYQEQLRQIQQRYQESAQDAIRRRDALALTQAKETRDIELGEAKRDRDKQRNEANADYARQQELQRRNLETQRQQAQQAYQEQLASLEASREDQEDELDRSLQRQLEDLERHNQWSLAAMKEKFSAEYKEAMEAYTSQEQLYAEHLARMQALFDSFQTPWRGPQPTGERGIIGGFQHGGAFVTGGPTTATFGEGGVPELVVAQPLSPVASPGASVSNVHSGTVHHEVSGAVAGLMEGYEGRLTAMINRAVMDAFTEVLRR